MLFESFKKEKRKQLTSLYRKTLKNVQISINILYKNNIKLKNRLG